MRLEGWRRVRSLWPSFETVACKRMRPPQDEVGLLGSIDQKEDLARRHFGNELAVSRQRLAHAEPDLNLPAARRHRLHHRYADAVLEPLHDVEGRPLAALQVHELAAG